ncbi:MAG TPA: peptidylprolyl isomerase, partial [Kofleriaceae bacterium]|nr:peptidylprolyl isomerase [Kofleriaceae bacterium]
RGLGRIGATGGAPVSAALIAALGDTDSTVVAAAAGAIGVAASLDDGELGATDALLQALPRGGAAVVEALGRAGTAAAQPRLVGLLTDPKLGEQAGLALGRHGRRKVELTEPSRTALVAATASPDPAVRYAAVYALAREFQPPAHPAAATALAARIVDPVAEIRAQAIAGLGRRKAVADARNAGARLDELLLDRDWRVAVEAVRALGDSDDGKDAIAAAIVRRFNDLERGEPTAAQVILEGERTLATAARRPLVEAALGELAGRARTATAVPELTRGWIACLAASASARAAPDPELSAVEQCPLPDHLRLPLVAQLIAADAGSLATRRAALARLLAHGDPRVRAAGLGALAALWKAGDAADHKTAIATLVAALAAPDPVVASAAVDAAGPIYEAIGQGDHTQLDAAVLARATAERDPELGAAILELVGKRALPGGQTACRAALTGDPVRAKAGAACLKALGETAPEQPLTASPPPVDISALAVKRLRWRVTTSRGDIVIALRPDVAPWAVAAIVALTRKRFYDGLEFHRVVGNFVVQGGDPSESGSGGPGFALPAEPAALGDGTGYVAGGVGIADAGRDSGGSQWFIMHSSAPHLDGRYTWIGAVESGQKSADALLVGDRIVRAAIE